MDLSLTEAATILGISPRTLRARVLRGSVPGVKRGGRWFLQRHALPLTDGQRKRSRARAEEIRRAVDEALPSHTARTRGDRRRSVADVESFRIGRDVFQSMSALPVDESTGEALAALRAGLIALSQGTHAFSPEDKLASFLRARSEVSRCIALLLLSSKALEEPRLTWIADLESGVLPTLGGLLRWTEKLARRSG